MRFPRGCTVYAPGAPHAQAYRRRVRTTRSDESRQLPMTGVHQLGTGGIDVFLFYAVKVVERLLGKSCQNLNLETIVDLSKSGDLRNYDGQTSENKYKHNITPVIL